MDENLENNIDTIVLHIGVSRGGCRGLPLLPMQHPEMAHSNFESSVFVSKKTVNKILKLDQK